MHLLRVFLLSLMIPLASISAAEGRQDASDAGRTDAEEVSVTLHSIELSGRRFEYRVRAGLQPLLDDQGKKRAEIFFTAYELRTDTPRSKRPVTFVFNGGPGSSSVWLHLGGLAPRRVLMTDEGKALRPPGKLVVNPHTWIKHTDLVFIDPVGTGYSRPAEGVEGKEFWGLDEDISSVGEFIRLYTSRHQRWSSPKFLAGESYGTTRAAGLAAELQGRHNMWLNGIILISPILQFQTARFDEGNDLPYPLFLPTFTATAWFHRRLGERYGRDLRATLAEVEEFAQGDYLTALAKGDRLTSDERDKIASRLSAYTGLEKDVVLRNDLRINQRRFCKNLLLEKGRTVGRLDSRFQGMDRDQDGDAPSTIPAWPRSWGRIPPR